MPFTIYAACSGVGREVSREAQISRFINDDGRQPAHKTLNRSTPQHVELRTAHPLS